MRQNKILEIPGGEVFDDGAALADVAEVIAKVLEKYPSAKIRLWERHGDVEAEFYAVVPEEPEETRQRLESLLYRVRFDAKQAVIASKELRREERRLLKEIEKC
jgi:hypothetical protein